MRPRLLAAVLLLALAAAAHAAQGWAYDMADELMSPYCPGRTLAECPSSQADTLRLWLITQEAAGRERAEVEAELIERFGEKILAAPRPRGFGLAAYLVPVVAAVLGGALLLLFLRRQTAAARALAPAAAPLDPELERLVDEELSR